MSFPGMTGCKPASCWSCFSMVPCWGRHVLLLRKAYDLKHIIRLTQLASFCTLRL